jgi:hypothetical protein
MSKSKSLPQILAIIRKPVFTANDGLTPKAYAVEQMKGRGNSFAVGPYAETGRKLIAADEVNGYAFCTLWRVELTEAAKPDVKGHQIVVYDLAGNVISATPLDDTAPKGPDKAAKVYGDTKKSIKAQGDSLLLVAAQGEYDAGEKRQAELRDLIELLAPEAAPEAAAEPA